MACPSSFEKSGYTEDGFSREDETEFAALKRNIVYSMKGAKRIIASPASKGNLGPKPGTLAPKILKPPRKTVYLDPNKTHIQYKIIRSIIHRHNLR